MAGVDLFDPLSPALSQRERGFCDTLGGRGGAAGGAPNILLSVMFSFKH